MIRIDMHVHSSWSDGTCTVREIVRQAARRRVALLALTDHDTVDGIAELARECGKYSVRPLPGVELSAKCSYTAHILGYRLLRPEPLKEAVEWVLERRNERNRGICKRLEELGIVIDLQELASETGGRVTGRPHFASLLVKKGFARDAAEAFSKYLARGALAYVSRDAYSPEDCVKIIRQSEGLPVLAHPSLTGLDADELGDFLEELKRYGLWGLECISSHCSADESLLYLGIAERHSLFPTAGSDFHGSRRPGASLGVQVTESFLPWARLGVSL
jgi:predicted metal-dependent phosphoesterase TrpH